MLSSGLSGACRRNSQNLLNNKGNNNMMCIVYPANWYRQVSALRESHSSSWEVCSVPSTNEQWWSVSVCQEHIPQACLHAGIAGTCWRMHFMWSLLNCLVEITLTALWALIREALSFSFNLSNLFVFGEIFKLVRELSTAVNWVLDPELKFLSKITCNQRQILKK